MSSNISILPEANYIMKQEIGMHGFLAQKNIDKYSSAYCGCVTRIGNKFSNGEPNTIFNASYTELKNYSPDSIYAQLLVMCLIPISERALLRSSLVDKDHSIDHLRVAINYLESCNLLKRDQNENFLSNIPGIDQDFRIDYNERESEQIRKFLLESFTQGMIRCESEEISLLEGLPYVSKYRHKTGRNYIVVDPKIKNTNIRSLYKGEMDFLYELFPFDTYNIGGFPCLQTSIFSAIMNQPIIGKEHFIEAPEFVPDIVLENSRNMHRILQDRKYIKNERVQLEGERMLSLRLGAPLAFVGYINNYDFFPIHIDMPTGEQIWERMIPVIKKGIIEEILYGYITEWREKANDKRWCSDFISLCQKEEYYDIYQVAKQLKLNLKTLEQILRKAWKYGICGKSVSSHTRFYGKETI